MKLNLYLYAVFHISMHMINRIACPNDPDRQFFGRTGFLFCDKDLDASLCLLHGEVDTACFILQAILSITCISTHFQRSKFLIIIPVIGKKRHDTALLYKDRYAVQRHKEFIGMIALKDLTGKEICPLALRQPDTDR